MKERYDWNCILSNTYQFYISRHCHYIRNLDSEKETLDHLMSDHLRMGGVFWGLGALNLMGCLPYGVDSKTAQTRTSKNTLSLTPAELSHFRSDSHCYNQSDVKDDDGSGDESCRPGLHKKDLERCSDGSIKRNEALKWVLSCWDPSTGGYGSNVGHDAHITSTLVNVFLRIVDA